MTAPATRPVLDGARLNDMAPRDAMALPPYLMPGTSDGVRTAAARLAGTAPAELAALVESSAPLVERLAAGALVALVGDPRLAHGLAPAMVRVAGGRARLGTPAQDVETIAERWRHHGVLPAWIQKEAPCVETTVAPFRLGRYAVTNHEYRAFLLDTRFAELPTSWPLGAYPTHAANHPVHSVSPAAADAYVAWLAARTGRRFRLPTELEWEWAAAGPGRPEFPWGDRADAWRANTVELGLLASTAVGSFAAGAAWCGALDMAGNVEEIVADGYRPYPGGTRVVDDLERQTPGYRMTRGGSFSRFLDLARCRRRHGVIVTPLYAIGFRVAEDEAPATPPREALRAL